jgi:PAS domain S-box-containing protein
MDNSTELNAENIMLRTISRLEQQLSDALARIAEMEIENRSLHKTQRTLQMMAENVDDLIAVVDREGNRVWNNPAYFDVLGYRPDDIEGTNSFEELHPDDRSVVAEAFQSAMTQGIAKSVEYRMRHRDGSWVLLESHARIVHDSAGNPQYLVLVARDITERKQEEEEKTKGNRVAAMSLVAEGLAQEYNDIISAILRQLDLAKQNAPVGSVFYNKVLDAEDEAARAEMVTRRVSELAKGDSLQKRPIDLGPLLQEIGSELTHKTVCRCDYVLPPELPAVLGNEPSLRRLLTNILTNAVESMSTRGVIRISAESLEIHPRTKLRPAGLPPGSYVRLQIRDQGCGMDSEIVPKIFEPYFTTKKGHTGMGLTTALSVAKNHGGTILAQSTLNVGTSLIIFLEASEWPAEPVESAPPTKLGVETPGRILVMDDEKIVTDFLELALTRQGFEVVTAADGAQAIAAYLKARSLGKPFDVVIMDILVPGGVGGLDALNTLHQFNPNLISILASGKSDEIEWDQPEKYGATRLLKKPFSVPVLQNLLKELVLLSRQTSAP